MTPIISMRSALSDTNLLASLMPGDSWAVWKALLIGGMGEELDEAETALFRQRTGRDGPPTEPVGEWALIAGRRSGKTAAASVLAIYLSILVDWKGVLKRGGERGTLLFLAQSQKTAKIAFRYARHAFEELPLLRKEVTSIGQDVISLRNGVDLEIRSASFRGLRGLTSVGIIADEVGYWYSDELSKNPDTEILNAARPSLATTGAPLILVSSPYSKRGSLWEVYRQHFGPAGDPRILVAQGSSRDFNSTLSAAVVQRAIEADPDRATSEYLGKFRDDLVGYLTFESVTACVEGGVGERQPEAAHKYYAFVDPSGGSSDSMSLSIAHKVGSVAIVDVAIERKPPFHPEGVVQEFAEILRRYKVGQVWGDKYGGSWVSSQFIKNGIGYLAAPLTKSQIYVNFAPIVNSGKVSLLDVERLILQLTSLERRVGRGGGADIVDHPSGGHDDLSNAVAGATLALGFHDILPKKPAPPPPPQEGWRYDIRVGELFGLDGFPDRSGRRDDRIRL